MGKEFQKYAEYYDAVYFDKSYKEECNFINKIFKSFSKNPVRTVLDVGCGTGEHAILLAKSGYEILGIDSSKMMIENAKKKADDLSVDFRVMDMTKLNLGKKFDACVCMFDVINYITDNHDIRKTF